MGEGTARRNQRDQSISLTVVLKAIHLATLLQRLRKNPLFTFDPKEFIGYTRFHENPSCAEAF